MFEQLITPRVNPVVLPADLASFGRFDLPVQYDPSPPTVSSDYALIQTFIDAASDAVEQMVGGSCCSQQWLITFDFFPGTQDPRQLYNYQLGWAYNWIPLWWYGFPVTDSIELIRRPVEVGGSPPLDPIVYYDDPNGDEQILDPTTYICRCDKITLLPGQYWPPTSRLQDCIRINYSAGYSVDNSLVPSRLKTAIMFLAAWWYENRMPAGTEPSQEIKFTLSNLIGPFKSNRIPR
jgi:hypothetical protein